MDDKVIIQETGYRKGFYNGYERAILDLQAMIREGSPPDQAMMTSLEYVIDDLKEWRYGNPSPRVLPPQLNPRKWYPSSTLNSIINSIAKNVTHPTSR